jgi:hypothetical protein
VNKLAITIIATVIGSTTATAQLAVTYTGSVVLPTTTSDQHGDPFTIAGLSGVTYLGDQRYVAVMDNSDKLVFFDLAINSQGEVIGVSNVTGMTLSHAGDHEGIAVSGPGLVMISDESLMRLKEFRLSDGVQLRQLAVPDVFLTRRPNLGLESLSIQSGTAWTANEEALTVDGNRASPTTGTAVRLASLDVATGAVNGQWVYLVEPMHGDVIPGSNPGQSGLSELVVLPNGRMLALERSLALASPFFLTRIYSIDLSGATEVSEYTQGLSQSVIPVVKTHLYTGGHNNLEGLCLGPELSGGGLALVGIVDDGDPFSLNEIVTFRLEGIGDGGGSCLGDIADSNGVLGNSDGVVNFGDLLALFSLSGPCFGGIPGCEGDFADSNGVIGNPDGQVNFGDLLAMFSLAGPCP